jgi:hypothetical protein
MRQLMQQQFALFAALDASPALHGASVPRFSSHGPQIFWELFVDLAAQTLRNSGAFACRRDGDLQIAAPDHRAEEEIAVGNIVDAVA